MQRVCVYCSETKDFQRGRRAGDFNSEHVVPEALASVRNSLTLIGIVCKDCNDLFGRTIDQALTRGSVEAIRRFLEKQKPVEKIGELDRRKVRISLENASDESIRGAHVELTHDAGELKQRFAVQLIIKLKDTGTWVAIKREELPEFVQSAQAVDLTEFKILGSPREAEEFFEEIRSVWPNLQIIGNVEPEDHITDVIVDYGPSEQRAIAKIAFNYFCYITQDSPNIALGNEFNSIRQFIRFGTTLCDYDVLDKSGEKFTVALEQNS